MKKYFGEGMPIETEQEWDSVFKKQCKTVAKTLKISIHEAAKRQQALFESGLMENGHPDDPMSKKAIDLFLSNPHWEKNHELVLMDTKREMAFPEVFIECISKKEMVESFDRLSGTNLSQLIKDGKFSAKDEPQIKKQLDKFEKFVREFIWARLPLESFK